MGLVDGSETISATHEQRQTSSQQSVPAPSPHAHASYASYEDFNLRFQDAEVLQISQAKVSNPTAPDVARVRAALLDASDTLDSYLRPKYHLGISALHASPPPVLIRHTCNIARYQLAQNKATEQQRQQYEDAIEWAVSMLASGSGLLTADGELIKQNPEEVSASGEAAVGAHSYSGNNPARPFTQDKFARNHAIARNARFHSRWG